MRIIKNILLMLISVACVLVIADWALQKTRLASLIKKDFYPRHYFVADAELGFDIAPNQKPVKHVFFDASYDIWSNSLGCYDKEYDSSTPYIYLTGDSFAWGFAPFESKWGKILESSLGVRVLTCGVGGYGTRQEFLKTSRHLAKLPKPEVIVVGYLGANDVEDDAEYPNGTVYEGYLVENLAKGEVTEEEAQKKYALFHTYCMLSLPNNRFVQRTKCFLNNNSVIYNLIKNNARKIIISILPQSFLERAGVVVSNATSTPTDYAKIPSYQAHLENVLAFKRLAQESGARLLFVLIPSRDEFKAGKAPYNDRMKMFLDKEGIDYLDLMIPLSEHEAPRDSMYWIVDGHFSERGNKVAGYLVSKHFLDYSLVPIADSAVRKRFVEDSLSGVR